MPAVLVTAGVLVVLGAWTYTAVERSLRELRAATLAAALEAEVKALELWIENHKIDVRRVARDPQVRRDVEALAKIAARPGVSPAEYCSAPARRPLVQQLAAGLEEEGAVAFNAVDRSGRIIASRFPEYCGRMVTPAAFSREFERVFRGGETRFVRPYAEAERLQTLPERLPLERPVTWIETPVYDAAGRIVAALGFGEYADGQFAAILAAGRSGETGEAYAFERSGALLTPGRFAAGAAVTPLAVRASGAEQGVALDPHPGYHGALVIAAWRWLPEYDLGVAAEIGADEAYAPLRYLRIAFGAVFGALVIAVAAALASLYSVIRLRREIGDGRKLGPYVLRERIAEGGAANIYLARHALLKRPTAVKLLKPGRATDEMIARFMREAQLASSLAHPNMVEIFDYGHTRDGVFYYAMEYLDGLTVTELVERSEHKVLPVARAVHLLRQTCAGLAEAHAKGLVHRDVKPENIMACRYGGEYDFVKILDFGLVKQVSGQHSRDLTRGLRILGTPMYMAPERLRDPGDVDARADIYAVGAVAFFMLAGRRLYLAEDDLALTTRILNEEPPRLSSVAPQLVPPEFERLVAACLEKDRGKRPQRVTDLIEAFDALGAGNRWTQQDARTWWESHAAAEPLAA